MDISESLIQKPEHSKDTIKLVKLLKYLNKLINTAPTNLRLTLFANFICDQPMDHLLCVCDDIVTERIYGGVRPSYRVDNTFW